MHADLFVTCLIEAFFPEVGASVVRVLRRAGVAVDIPAGQTCCGQPLFNAGFRQLARAQARRTLDAFGERRAPLVVPSGSCAAMIRHGYLELFADDPSDLTRATQLAGRTFELSQFLWEVLRWAPPARPAADLVYHASCHLQRGLGVDEAPRRLLEQACGGPPAELEPECCGFGGIFAVEHAAISRAMLARRIGQIEASGAQRVVGGDVGCLMHLEGGLRRKGSPIHCAHLAQILDRGSGTLK